MKIELDKNDVVAIVSAHVTTLFPGANVKLDSPGYRVERMEFIIQKEPFAPENDHDE